MILAERPGPEEGSPRQAVASIRTSMLQGALNYEFWVIETDLASGSPSLAEASARPNRDPREGLVERIQHLGFRGARSSVTCAPIRFGPPPCIARSPMRHTMNKPSLHPAAPERGRAALHPFHASSILHPSADTPGT